MLAPPSEMYRVAQFQSKPKLRGWLSAAAVPKPIMVVCVPDPMAFVTAPDTRSRTLTFPFELSAIQILLPVQSIARPRGLLNFAFVPTPFAAPNVACPANVVTMNVSMLIARIAWLPLSDANTVRRRKSTISPFGALNFAAVPTPSTNPATPLPAIVNTSDAVRLTPRTLWLASSATRSSVCASLPHFKSNGALNLAVEKLPSTAPAAGLPTRVATQHTVLGLQGAVDALGVREAVAVVLRVADGVTVGEAVALAVPLTEGVIEGVLLMVGVNEGVPELVGVPDAVGPKGHISCMVRVWGGLCWGLFFFGGGAWYVCAGGRFASKLTTRRMWLLLSLMIMAPSVARTMTPLGPFRRATETFPSTHPKVKPAMVLTIRVLITICLTLWIPKSPTTIRFRV